MEINGIDVSRWQGDIDWGKAASAGVRFAMIKAVQGGKTDPKFKRNITGAIKNGVFAGAYVYSLARTPEEARGEADAVLELCEKYELRYPVALDLEDKSLDALTKKELGDIACAFLDRIREGGRIPMLYSNRDWFKRRIPRSVVKKYYIWLAQWRDERPEADFDFAVWQRGTGRVDGIDGDVDLDVCFVDFSELTAPPLRFYPASPRLRGEAYLAMQKALNAAHYRDSSGNVLAEDGVWGARSMEAFRTLLKVNGQER